MDYKLGATSTGNTTSTSATPVYLAFGNEKNNLTIEANSSYGFSILAKAIRLDVAGEYEAWQIRGMVSRQTTLGSLAISFYYVDRFSEPAATSWVLAPEVDTDTGLFRVKFTGENGKTIWVEGIVTFI